MDTSSSTSCFTGVLVLRRDDTVNENGINESMYIYSILFHIRQQVIVTEQKQISVYKKNLYGQIYIPLIMLLFIVEELLRVTVQEETVPTATELAPVSIFIYLSI